MTTAERVIELFQYNPESGEFVRRKRVTNSKKLAGSVKTNGYISIHFDGKNHAAHRMAWLYVYGFIPESALDHINGNRADNRIENLRIATRSGNAQNLHKAYSNNKSSGILGVYWHAQVGKWQAKITHEGKAKSLGLFNSAHEASLAYLTKKRELHAFCTI